MEQVKWTKDPFGATWKAEIDFISVHVCVNCLGEFYCLEDPLKSSFPVIFEAKIVALRIAREKLRNHYNPIIERINGSIDALNKPETKAVSESQD